MPDEEVFNYDPGGISWSVETNITDWTATSSQSWCVPAVSSNALQLTIEDYLFGTRIRLVNTSDASNVIEIYGERSHTVYYYPNDFYGRPYQLAWAEED